MLKSKKIGGILVELGFITHEQLDAALLYQKKTVPYRKLGELLVELGFLDEVDVLKCLSGLFKVPYVPSDKLASMSISSRILTLIPTDFAEQHCVLPFFCYDKARTLSVLVPDPQDKEIPRLIRKVSGYNIDTYLSLEIAIEAGIAKFYKNDEHAFNNLKKQLKAGFPASVGSFVPDDQDLLDKQYIDPVMVSSQQDVLAKVLVRQPADKTVHAPLFEDKKNRLADRISPLSLISEDTFVELFNIIVYVLEMYKQGVAQGHSAQVAKLVKQVSQLCRLPVRDTYCNVLCGYLHDCCLNAPEHLTVFHSESDEYAELLDKYSKANERLFEKARLPHSMSSVLFHTFERFDGKGLPDGLKGPSIPLGARIISTVDAFIHSRDTARKETAENPYLLAIETIKGASGTLFDPQVVDHLEEVIAEYLVSEHSPSVVIVDEYSEQFDQLAARLKKRGIKFYRARHTDEAEHFIKDVPVTLVISDVNTRPKDGFAFCAYIKTTYPELRFVFLSEQDDPALINKGFDLGAEDFLTKPYNPDILSAKIQNLTRITVKPLQKPAEESDSPQKRGITGNLAEIGVTDLIQMLFSGRKTGRLRLFKDDETGEISFDHGEIIAAEYKNLSAVESFSQLVRWDHGLFALNPEEELPQQMIFESTEHLILEAYRRWDEKALDEEGTGEN